MLSSFTSRIFSRPPTQNGGFRAVQGLIICTLVISQLLHGEVPSWNSVAIPVERSDQPHRYSIEVGMRLHTSKSASAKALRYAFELECLPAGEAKSEPGAVTYTCRRFEIQTGEQSAVTIPELEGWTYRFAWPSNNASPDGNAFGLPMSKFLALQTSDGASLKGMMGTLVYNALTDYHILCNIYAQPYGQPLESDGIQDLVGMGDRIVHGTAHLVTPLSGVPGMLEGSEFRHGEVVLEWRGLGEVDGRTCAIVGFDSGENQNRMLMEPAPDFRIENTGDSHHRGELFIDLETGWVLKANMMEIVVNRTKAGNQDAKSVVIERYLTLSGEPIPTD